MTSVLNYLRKTRSLLLRKFFVYSIGLLLEKDSRVLLKEILRSFVATGARSVISEVLYVLPFLNDSESLTVLNKILDPKSVDLHLTDEQMDQIVNFSSYERDAWVQEKLKNIPASARVLDAGAGQCRYKSFLNHTRYETQDFAQYLGRESGPLKETWDYGKLDYVCDITNIPVEDGSFDAVLCTEVLEHVPDPISAIKELARLITPGGVMIVTAPLGSGVHQEPYHFYGGFSKYFFERYFEEFGLDIIEIKPIGGLLKHVAQENYRVSSILAGGNVVTKNALYVLKEWLPKTLSELDDRFFVEQFTVGYLIEARKRDA
ncbi:MAG: Methyltransferase type 11 [Proteobacteria bacterium]|nr:Methyltransferase type 11 [Pseudomonadota bacterium]